MRQIADYLKVSGGLRFSPNVLRKQNVGLSGAKRQPKVPFVSAADRHHRPTGSGNEKAAICNGGSPPLRVEKRVQFSTTIIRQ